jgi:hypothetical protein
MRTHHLIWLVPLVAACSDGSSGPTPISCATSTSARQTAAVVDLQPGQSASFLTSAAAAGCLEIEPQADSRYILGVVNVTPNGASTTSFRVSGGDPNAPQANVVARARTNPAGNLRDWLLGTPEQQRRSAERTHRRVLDADRRLMQRRGNPAGAIARLRARAVGELRRIRREMLALVRQHAAHEVLPPVDGRRGGIVGNVGVEDGRVVAHRVLVRSLGGVVRIEIAAAHEAGDTVEVLVEDRRKEHQHLPLPAELRVERERVSEILDEHRIDDILEFLTDAVVERIDLPGDR